MSSLFCGRDVTKDLHPMFIIDVATIHDGCQILDLLGHLVSLLVLKNNIINQLGYYQERNPRYYTFCFRELSKFITD